jgi:hypothetical protein
MSVVLSNVDSSCTRFVFLVQGSDDEPYEVTFARTAHGFTAVCTCRAGQSRQSCKHRLRILGGSAADVVSPNADDVHAVSSWLADSAVARALAAVEAAEEALELAKRHVSAAKQGLARALAGEEA